MMLCTINAGKGALKLYLAQKMHCIVGPASLSGHDATYQKSWAAGNLG